MRNSKSYTLLGQYISSSSALRWHRSPRCAAAKAGVPQTLLRDCCGYDCPVLKVSFHGVPAYELRRLQTSSIPIKCSELLDPKSSIVMLQPSVGCQFTLLTSDGCEFRFRHCMSSAKKRPRRIGSDGIQLLSFSFCCSDASRLPGKPVERDGWILCPEQIFVPSLFAFGVCYVFADMCSFSIIVFFVVMFVQNPVALLFPVMGSRSSPSGRHEHLHSWVQVL